MKRTPMPRRRAPLRSRPPTRRVNRSTAPARKPDPDRDLWRTLRAALYVRAGARCERCGTDLDRAGMQAHHRKLRSQGGAHDLTNLVALCPTCHHDQVHAHPVHAREHGWIVPGHADPAMRAVVLHDGRTVRLTPEGTYDICWSEGESA